MARRCLARARNSILASVVGQRKIKRTEKEDSMGGCRYVAASLLGDDLMMVFVVACK